MPPSRVASSNSGYPIYAVSDIASQVGGDQVIPVEQPRIYFGEVIAQADPTTPSSEARGARRASTTPTPPSTPTAGPVGCRWEIGSTASVFAANFAEHNILFSGAIGSESKIIFNRDPAEPRADRSPRG